MKITFSNIFLFICFAFKTYWPAFKDMLQHEIKADTFFSVRNTRDVICADERSKKEFFTWQKKLMIVIE